MIEKENYEIVNPELQRIGFDILKEFSSVEIANRDDEIDRLEKDAELKSLQSHIENCGIGKKYFYSRFENFDAYTENLQNALATCKEFVKDLQNGMRRSLWLCGKNGNGKTHLAASILYALGYGHYVKSYEIEDELETAKLFSSKTTPKAVMQKYCGYELLVIDEIGRFAGEKELGYLFRISNEIYENGGKIIFITNLDKKPFKEYLGQAMFDRFSEYCTSITFNEESYRTKIREVV